MFGDINMAYPHRFFISLMLLPTALHLAPAGASEQDDRFIESLTRSAVSLAAEGDPSGIGTLRLLLGLDENYRHVFSDLVEQTHLAETLPKSLQSFNAADQVRARRLLEQLGDAEGAATRPAAKTASADTKSVTVNFDKDKTQWIAIPPSPEGSGELVLYTAACTPDLTVFGPSTPLPSTVALGSVRYTASLLGIPTASGAAIRVRPGSCEEPQVTLEFSWHPTRTTLPEVITGYAPIVPDQMTIVALTSASRPFSVQTQPGYVYSVYAAPLDSDVDPILARLDPDKDLALIDSDDDGGWRTAAKLDAIVGTGRLEKFTVSRNNATQGNVAVFVTAQAIPLRDREAASVIDVTAVTPGWERICLPAGAWVVETTDLSTDFDPILSVFDAKSGKLLARNDDADEHTVASRVKIDLHESSELVMRVDSADKGGGSTHLAVRPDTARTRPTKHQNRLRGLPSSALISTT
jgi:hypothetical protein